jgi:benzoate/toluate 1,2-dioxygenase alpha subunit
VHWNYTATMGRRNYEGEGVRTVDANGWSKSVGGVYGFEHGHILLWTNVLNPEVRPNYAHREAMEARLGKERAGRILGQTRNLGLYPNVYLMDQFSTQIRVVRPISVNQTEVTIYCFAPKGEAAAERALRIRQYEDFFNVSGMGTPDDLEEFRACQTAYEGGGDLWNDLSRGAVRWVRGADENARGMGLEPILSGGRSEDEGLFVRQHEFWAKTLIAALDKDGGGDGGSAVRPADGLRVAA